MIKNRLFSTGQIVTLATGQTYVVKDDEVFIEGHLFKREDCEITIQNNFATQDASKVKIGIQSRGNRKEHPAYHCLWNEWEIDGAVPTDLADATDKIQTAIYFAGGNNSQNAEIKEVTTISGQAKGICVLTQDEVGTGTTDLPQYPKGTYVKSDNYIKKVEDNPDIIFVDAIPANKVNVIAQQIYRVRSGVDAGLYFTSENKDFHLIMTGSSTKADMAQTDINAPDYVLNKNRVVTVNADSNLAVAWDDTEVFNENQDLSVTLTDVPLGHSFILTSGIGAKTTIDISTYTVVNLRDNLEVNEKESVIIYRLQDGRFLIRG